MASIVIVGGGIAGTALAYILRDSDHEVTLIEKDGIGSGTTGKSIACFAWHVFPSGVGHEITKRSWAIYEPLIQDGTFTYHKNGFLKTAESAASFAAFEAAVKELQAAGIEATVLTGDELEAYNVNPDASPEGAAFFPTIGRLDPGEIVSHFAGEAREAGVSVETGLRVTDVTVEDSAATAVETTEGAFEADVVVNAGGPWSPILNEMAGVSIPLKHTLAPIAVLETTEQFDLPTVILDGGLYFTGERSAKVLAGHAPHEAIQEDFWTKAERFDDPDTIQGMGQGSVGEAHRQTVADKASWAIPKLAGAEISNEWRGIRCITPDHRPVVGETTLDGFYVLTGMSGAGITMGPGAAAVLAEHLETGEPSDHLEWTAPARFADGIPSH